mmetsp:Transcript_12436/g.31765  ORF Transcript_12436/g.31765 Transcript_12436/m.31765 type:complete len:87 (-) Transcript_12436:115-375(-)
MAPPTGALIGAVAPPPTILVHPAQQLGRLPGRGTGGQSGRDDDGASTPGRLSSSTFVRIACGASAERGCVRSTWRVLRVAAGGLPA